MKHVTRKENWACVRVEVVWDLLELERGLVEVERGPVALAHVEGDVLGVEGLHHGARRLVHQLLGEAEAAVRALDGQRGDVSVRLVAAAGAVGGRLRLLLHLGEDVADDGARAGVLGHEAELRPREAVVHVVLRKNITIRIRSLDHK